MHDRSISSLAMRPERDLYHSHRLLRSSLVCNHRSVLPTSGEAIVLRGYQYSLASIRKYDDSRLLFVRNGRSEDLIALVSSIGRPMDILHAIRASSLLLAHEYRSPDGLLQRFARSSDHLISSSGVDTIWSSSIRTISSRVLYSSQVLVTTQLPMVYVSARSTQHSMM
jgi:hypothetical protein